VAVRGRGGGEGVRTRDHLANVRTTLTWVRTGMILMGVGYTADKLAALDALHGVSSGLRMLGHPLGLLLVAAGVFFTGVALPRFLRARARIESAEFAPRVGADLALVGALGIGGVALLVVLAVAR
jgi:putative membrane protein